MSNTRENREESGAEGLQVLSKAKTSGLLSLLMLQVQKDYERAGLDFPISESQLLTEDVTVIFTNLKEDIYLLLMEHFDQYLNLLYTVDIPEREFQKVDPADAVEAADQLSGVILKREWQKIQWRRSFPGSGSSQK